MGFAKTPLNPPNQFLKKSNHGTPKNAIAAPPFKYKVLNCHKIAIHVNIKPIIQTERKPPVPTHKTDHKPELAQKNFIKEASNLP